MKTFTDKLRSLLRSKAGSGAKEELRLARERVAEKNRMLKRLREQLEQKDRELKSLRSRLSRAIDGESTPVFFVVGRAKSGTSWLMRILDAHPEVLCKGEGWFFGRDFIQENFKRGQQGRIQPSSLYRALLEAEYLEAWIERSVWTRGDDVQEHLANLMRLSTGYFLSQRLARSGKKIVGDKTPLLSDTVVEEIAEIYPGAKVIHIIRDGRDAAVSLVYHRWNHARDEGGIYELRPEELAKRRVYRTDPEGARQRGEGLFPEGMLGNLADDWKHRTTRITRDGRSLLEENYAEVRYEDLLERPYEEVRRLLSFLEADASEKLVKECVSSASFEKWAEGRERGQEDSRAFLRKGVAGDWKNVFTEQDKRIFKEAAGDLLVDLDYEKDYDW